MQNVEKTAGGRPKEQSSNFILPLMQQIVTFFMALYGESTFGWLTLWTKQDRRTRYFELGDLNDFANEAIALQSANDVYFGIGLRKELPFDPLSRGDAKSVVAIPGLWLEFDHQSPNHAATNLPEKSEVAPFLKESFPLNPSLIMHTGGGFLYIWLTDELVNIKDDKDREYASMLLKRLHAVVNNAAQKKGWTIDNISDLARLVRVPFTLNHKPAKYGKQPQNVELLALKSDRRYTIKELEEAISVAEAASPLEQLSSYKMDSKPRLVSDYAPSYASKILEECRWLQHCRIDAATLSEPEWMSMLPIIARTVEGPLLCHQLSKPHPEYSIKETEYKIERAMTQTGPTTCSRIKQEFGEWCVGCKHNVTSPIILGLDQQTIDVRIEEKRSDEIEWEPPVPFEKNEPLPPFPALLFPSWIRDYAEAFAERVQVPIDAPYMAALSVISTALMKKFVVSLPQHRWIERINLYTVTIMPPSEKKSETIRVFSDPLQKFEEMMRSLMRPLHLKQKEIRDAKFKRIEHLKTKYAKNQDSDLFDEITLLRSELDAEIIIHMPQFNTTDCTQERLVALMEQNEERMAVISAEGGILDIIAGRYTGGMLNLDIFLNSYSGDLTRVDRQGRSEILQEPALTFGLFVQPIVMTGLPQGMEKRGLLGRFLFSLPESRVGYRKLVASKENPLLKERYSQNMTKLLELKENNQQLTLDAEAYSIFNKFWLRVEFAQRDGGELSDNILSIWGGKLAGNMLRVAANIHLAECIDKGEVRFEINGRLMNHIVQLGEYFIAHSKAVFNQMGVNEGMENAKYLLGIIQKQDDNCISKQTLWQKVSKRMKTNAILMQALAILTERGFVKVEKIGQKSVVFFNPFLASSTNSTKEPSEDFNNDLVELVEESLPEDLNSSENDVASFEEETDDIFL